MTLLFSPGQLMITSNAQRHLCQIDILRGLRRHLNGDWGDLCPEDQAENALALREGFRLLSSYEAEDGTQYWVITEADRSATTVLLPEDY